MYSRTVPLGEPTKPQNAPRGSETLSLFPFLIRRKDGTIWNGKEFLPLSDPRLIPALYHTEKETMGVIRKLIEHGKAKESDMLTPVHTETSITILE